MNKGLWMFNVFKNLYCPKLLHSFSPIQVLEQFPSPSPFAHLPPYPFATFFSFIESPQPHFHKSYPKYKTFLNIKAVPNSAVFCINAVLITTSSSSVHFFSFFDVLPIAPTTTEMTLMLIKFQRNVMTLMLFSLVPGISQFSSSLFH